MFSWNISFGQVVVTLPILSILVFLRHIDNKLTQFRIEHEFLMADWAKRQSPPMELSALPWRRK